MERLIKTVAASLLLSATLLFVGFAVGVKTHKEYEKEQAIKEDIFDQFTDILLDAIDDENGGVFYG